MAKAEGGSGLAGAIGKIAAIIFALTTLVTALDAFLQNSQAFSCHLSLAFPWCDEAVQPGIDPTPVRCRNDMTVMEYDRCEEQLRSG